MYCPQCSTEVHQGNFCPKCGYRLPQVGPQNIGYGAGVPQPYPPYPAAYYPQAQPTPEKNWAIASLVLGIASFIVLPIIFTPAGVICGAISLSKKSQGNVMAILGIVLSILGLLAGIAVGIALA